MPNKFLERFVGSHSAVEHSAEWLKSLGCKNITIPKPKLAPSHAQWKQYADKGDLFVGKTRIEVKGLLKKRYWFTRNYEYPYDNWIICAKHSYDRAIQKPYAYLIWNYKRTHVGIVKVNTLKQWKVTKIKDPNYDRYEDMYVIDKLMVEVRHFEI